MNSHRGHHAAWYFAALVALYGTAIRAISRSVILTLCVGAALVFTTPRLPGTDAAALEPGRPTLTDLHSVDELRKLFNRDVGKVRLVLLVSPT